MGIFPNEAAVLRLAGSVLVEVHDEWQVSDRRYLSEASMAKLYESGNDGGDRKEVGTNRNELLAGWLGKPHAVHQGVLASRGEWLLFTDADMEHHPASAATAVSYALNNQADGLSIFPQQATRGVVDRAALMVGFAGLFAGQRRHNATLNGQYILLRREVYAQSGGMTAVRNEMLEDFIAAFNHLKSHPECKGKIGVVGFCFGGGMVNELTVRIPDVIAAAVPFYGRQPATGDVPKIKAPLLIHYAELDRRINDGWPEFEKALKAAGTRYQAFIYPGVNHGFHNDTTPRYDEAAAKLAWQRTVEFFKKELT